MVISLGDHLAYDTDADEVEAFEHPPLEIFPRKDDGPVVRPRSGKLSAHCNNHLMPIAKHLLGLDESQRLLQSREKGPFASDGANLVRCHPLATAQTTMTPFARDEKPFSPAFAPA
jgi:hypothetical protein